MKCDFNLSYRECLFSLFSCKITNLSNINNKNILNNNKILIKTEKNRYYFIFFTSLNLVYGPMASHCCKSV